MVLEIPGSTPGAHPLLQDYAGLSPSGKAQAFDACISLVRIQLALFETLAQSVEHLTFNQVVAGSIPACLMNEIKAKAARKGLLFYEERSFRRSGISA